MLNRSGIGTRIAAGFALGLAMLTLIGIASYQTTENLIHDSQLEKHTYQVLDQLSNLERDLSSAESGQRGYVITGQPLYLQPYNEALQRIDYSYTALRQLTTDNAAQQQRLTRLSPLIDRRLNRLQEAIRLYDTEGFEAAQQFTQTNQGRQVMQQILAVMDEMEQEERQLLQERSRQAARAAQKSLNTIVFGIPVSFLLLSLIGYWLSRHISLPLRHLSKTAEKIAAGDLSVPLPLSDSRDETGVLTRTFRQMVINLRETIQVNEDQRWLTSNLAELSQSLQGQRNLKAIAQIVLAQITPLVRAQQGTVYLLTTRGEETVLQLLNSYAHHPGDLANQFQLGEGLIGQCALTKERIVLTEVPGEYLRIRSGLLDARPLTIVVLPLVFEDQVRGVLELASVYPFTPLHLGFLESASITIGIMMNAIAAYSRTQELLDESQTLTLVLQQQQKELLQTNRLLEERTQSLQESELLLKQQQEELQQSNEELQQLNEELEEKAELLESQKQYVERKNQEVEQAKQILEDQTKQLELSSKYKSQFLANMSHELRTPLNSLLILAKLLSENGEGNLTEKQVEYSRTIYLAGTDLLSLINDILDLAKIESGTMTIAVQPISLITLQLDLQRTFNPIAQSKGLYFTVDLMPDLPETVSTDPKRLQQILKNLLANALKFTEQGSVTLRISRTEGDRLAFAVRDTGIGIPQEKQQLIFETFQQADGTTSRRYGGTGLGLSISLELAHLLGGTIALSSEVNQGSTFTLYLPEQPPGQAGTDPAEAQAPGGRQGGLDRLAQDWLAQSSGMPLPLPESSPIVRSLPMLLLVIEDDRHFAHILTEMARRQGFKVLLAFQGQVGLDLAQRLMPDAITLDLHLPDMEGWHVLERLKANPVTRPIPVHILTVDDRQPREFQMGAIAHIQKPISPESLTQALATIRQDAERQIRHLLVIEDDARQAHSIIELIGGDDVESTIALTGADALNHLMVKTFDCVVLDLGLPDMSGLELIEQIKQNPSLATLPIIVYTGQDVTEQEETQLRRLTETIIVKDVRSPERLLDEATLFLHRVQTSLPPSSPQGLEPLQQADASLSNKTVLIVDDDVRNIFALTSLLEEYQMTILFAENGRAGLEVLNQHPQVNLVLMDVMMPELDGYETTRRIRQQERFRTLPIIMLTAKAMQGDREKCIDAGASDYITKPVDTGQLLSLLRLWLYR